VTVLAFERGLDAAIVGVRAVYQPIVDLRTRRVVAHEALARGPEGTDLERPDRLFAAAEDAGRVAELDWACRAAAVGGALDAGMGADDVLFVNVEPSTLRSTRPEQHGRVFDRAAAGTRLVLEITERDLTGDPAALLSAAAFARSNGWGIALDDVGAEPASLALMPFLHPDVIKLDMRLVQHPDSDSVEVVNAVRAQAERTGATVLAEGIETEVHLRTALAMGATLGQGWLFGRPGRFVSTGSSFGFLDAPPLDQDTTPRPRRTASCPGRAAARPVERTTKRLLLPTSRFLEARASREPEPPVVLSTFQAARHFTPDTARRYARLASEASFVGAVAADLGDQPVPGVRGAALAPDDPVRGEWDVLVTTPHFAAALVARDLGDDGPDGDRRFDYVVTYDRELVLAAARSLLARIVPD
jgi:EAL domain-containing protein (putative c-di-GMP-specific phosphodiesterase class I)